MYVPCLAMLIDASQRYCLNLHLVHAPASLCILPNQLLPRQIAEFCQCKQAENGELLVNFPKGVHAWRDFVYVDHDLHITVTNRNNIVAVRRVEGALEGA